MIMNKKPNEKQFVLIFPEEIMRLMDDFFETKFKADIEALKQSEKHPAHAMNDRIRQLTKTDEQRKPVGIDLPVLIKPEQSEAKATVVLLGQDPLRKSKDIDEAKVFDNAFIGTPYRVHHLNGLPTNTRVYPKLIQRLLEKGYDVYLTDVRKYYPSPAKESEKQQAGNADLLIKELGCLKGHFILVLSGQQSQHFYNLYKDKLDAVKSDYVICLPHLSGVGGMKKWKELAGCATHEAKIKYVMEKITSIDCKTKQK